MKRHLQKVRSAGSASADVIERTAGEIERAVASVPGLASLTPADRRRTVKPRTGGEHYAAQMAVLAKNDPRVRPMDVDPDQIGRDLDLADKLEVLHSALSAALQKVDDTLLLLHGHAYRESLEIYAVAQSLARRDMDLHAKIAGFEQFLANGPPARKPGEGKK
jgi:hypothetical protein